MTNPTERPEEREDDDVMEFIRDMASPTDGPDLTDEELGEHLAQYAERPEERDSLAEIEERHQPNMTARFRLVPGTSGGNRKVPVPGPCFKDGQEWPCDARTLINEVKELRDHAGRFRAYINLPGGWKERVAELEAEVKELREAGQAVLDYLEGMELPYKDRHAPLHRLAKALG